jgi:DNA-binding PadR family transcriptional regulator
MNKLMVLETFRNRWSPLTPDRLREICMKKYARTSVYAYLLRLKGQKLLESVRLGKRIAYQITNRGVKRIDYLRRKQNETK